MNLSVRFFKRVITFAVLGIILILTVTTIYYKVQYNKANSNDESNGLIDTVSATELDYQKEYSSLTVKRQPQKEDGSEKIVYLTFDDGPSTDITPKILDTLKKYDIKATFFMVYKNSEESKKIIERVIKEGHTIGIHSASHNYEKIYSSVESFLKDYSKMNDYLKKTFNYTPEIFRFPGGSINSYNMFIFDKIVPEMYRRGYTFYDWNVSSGDATTTPISTGEIKNAVINGVKQHNKSIVLMHDSTGKDTTLEALPGIIEKLKKDGYKFGSLDGSVKPIVFTYN